MIAMEGKLKNMSRVRIYLTHLLPALRKIQKRRSSLTQRQRAIQCVADMCLVRTARKGFAWNHALNLRLMRREKVMRTSMKMKELSSLHRSRSRTLAARRMRSVSLGSRYCNNVDIKTGSQDHGSIDRRLGTLQKLVPGGRKMGLDTLYRETADYILNLQTQLHAMEALADFYEMNYADRVDEFVVQRQQRSDFFAEQI